MLSNLQKVHWFCYIISQFQKLRVCSYATEGQGSKIPKICTKTDDKGTSAVFIGQRRAKDDAVFEALGATDELSSYIALAKEFATEAGHSYVDKLSQVQCVLQDVGSLIATPASSAPASHLKLVTFSSEYTKELEGWIDEYSEQLPPLQNFILPASLRCTTFNYGGGKASSIHHIARTVCRRAERSVTPLFRSQENQAEAQIYLNRLSDFLFTIAMLAAKLNGAEESIYIRPSIKKTPK